MYNDQCVLFVSNHTHFEDAAIQAESYFDGDVVFAWLEGSSPAFISENSTLNQAHDFAIAMFFRTAKETATLNANKLTYDAETPTIHRLHDATRIAYSMPSMTEPYYWMFVEMPPLKDMFTMTIVKAGERVANSS